MKTREHILRKSTRALDEWVGGWMGGWMDGWVDVEAGLRIAYSNQKFEYRQNGDDTNEKCWTVQHSIFCHCINSSSILGFKLQRKQIYQ